jgi:isoleucyl-tRNA synthetase
LAEDSSYTAHEVDILSYWEDINLQKKLEANEEDKPLYRFMDGPPFVSGELHVGHAAVTSIKSMNNDFWRQMGYKVTNKIGYDTHGLPVENKISKEHNLNTVADIDEMGIDEFCRLCKEMIHKYSEPSNPKSWPPAMKRMGRWADYTNVYKTMDREFMESCWYIFNEMFKKGLIYRGYKVCPYSWACQTPLSNFEATQAYKEKKTRSLFVAFPCKDEENTSFVAWTTTAWTLPSNMALCVGPDIDYLKIEHNDGQFFYISKSTVEKVFKKGTFKVVASMKGSELEGKEYIPIFDYFKDDPKLFKVITDTYVKDTPDTGSGIVHQSAPFGEDDFNICVRHGIITNVTVVDYCTVDKFGNFNDLVPDFKGMNVCDDETTSALIIKIKELGCHLKTQQYIHNYPYCWRTDKPLIYRIVKSVFLKVTDLTEKMLELNEKISWHPEHIGQKRFKNWLEGAKDWGLSRFRYFGNPIPLWENEDGELLSIGSVEELAKLAGGSPDDYPDLHKEFMDNVVITIDGKEYRRIPDIFDCWFESGSVPYAQYHYPFENKDLIDSAGEFLSDFIVEGIDQTRGWFYTLLVISTAMSDGKVAPFKNVITTGMILDSRGKKISKRCGNYIDMKPYLEKVGADILRMYFIGSPLVHAESLLFRNEAVDILKKDQIRYINAVKFLVEHGTNFQRNGHTFRILGRDMKFTEVTDVFDRWILSRLSDLSQNVKTLMMEYKYNKVVQVDLDFIEDLVNWYIKFNRSRMKGLCGDEEWSKSLSVLHYVIYTYSRITSSLTPFLSEYVYQHIYYLMVDGAAESIHLLEYPEVDIVVNVKLHDLFHNLKDVCSAVRTLRDSSKNHKSVRVPISKCTIYHNDPALLEDLKANMDMVQEEINCTDMEYMPLSGSLKYSLEPVFKEIGRRYGKNTKVIVNHIKSASPELAEAIGKGDDLVIVLKDVDTVINPLCYKVNKQVDISSDLHGTMAGDLMVSVNLEYTEDTEKEYVVKMIHCSVQNVRKELKLHPWNRLGVKVSKNVKSYLPDLLNKLNESLSNSEATWSNDDEYSYSTDEFELMNGDKFTVQFNVNHIDE